MKFYIALYTFGAVSANLMLTATAFTGNAAYYPPGLGECGRTNQASDFIVALAADKYDTGEDHCFKNVTVHYQGKPVTAMVADRCAECSPNDLNLSPAAFSQLADQSLSNIVVDWEFL